MKFAALPIHRETVGSRFPGHARRLAILAAALAQVCNSAAQTSQLVYSQDFNSAAIGTTGTGLGDGSNITDSSSIFNARVFSSTEWGSGITPNGQVWKALWLTQMSTGINGNFYTPVVNQGQSVSAFSANFTLLNNYANRTTEHMADGISVNFGKVNDTTSTYGGESGIYSPGDGKTGNVLTLSFYTYTAADPRIELRYNGSTIATNPMDPYWNDQNPPPASAFLPVNFSWDANGVDVTYFGTTVFSNVVVAGFTPGIDSRFAMAARTGASYQNTFVDDITIHTTAAPFVWTGGAGDWNTAAGWTIGAAPTTNNNWIVMSGAGGTTTNNAVTAVQGLVFDSAASGSYTLSGNAVTVGADGIVNNSSRLQTISSNLTLGASQTFSAASGALDFSGSVSLGANTLTLSAANDVAIGGVITGSGGSLAKTGAGTLTLAGANTYSGGTTVSAGTLAGDAASLQGAITNNAAVSFDQSIAGTYAGLMSGTGTLTKAGAGTLTLSGANTYTGATTLSAGKLLVNGSIASSTLTTVNSAATLGGSGTIGAATISGTHSPGNSPGIQTFMGDVTYQAGSTIIWELNANTTTGRGSNFDGINLTGSANLDFAGTTTLSLDFDAFGSAVDWSHTTWDQSITGVDGWKLFDLADGTVDSSYLFVISQEPWNDASGDTLASIRPNASFSIFQDGNDLYLNYSNVSAIPEPGSLLGLGLILGVPVLVRRRRPR
jgi:autotransporter-associated beta strand protein